MKPLTSGLKATRKKSEQQTFLPLKEANSMNDTISNFSENKSSMLNLEVERKAYLQHIKNLRLAHRIHLKNEKFLTMAKLEEIVSQKMVSYEDSIT